MTILPCKKCGSLKRYASGHCVSCKRAASAAYQRTHPEVNARADKKRRANKEANRVRIAAWRAANVERASALRRRYYVAHAVQELEIKRRWVSQNRERNRAGARARRATYRAKQAEAGGGFTSTEFLMLCLRYDNRCLSCQRTGIKLTADHVIPVSQGGTSNIANIQPLCLSWM